MKVESKQSIDEDQPQNPKIPEDYYETELVDIIDYPRGDDQAPGLIMKFKVLTEDVELENDFDLEMTDGDVIVPFFAPAKLSYSERAESSRLTDNLMKLGIHEPILNEFGIYDAVMKEDKRVIPESEDDLDEFKSTLKAFFDGKTVKADVSYGQQGDESQVNKFSTIVSHEDEDSESEEDDEDVIFDDDE